MSKKKVNEKFIPFQHEHLDIKQELLQMARNIKKPDQEDMSVQIDLASVLIYSNLTEYLAENLLESLNHYVKKSTYKEFAGILYINHTYSEDDNMTLGILIKELNKFSFPDKESILKSFKKISESRNRIFHNLAKSSIEEIGKLLHEDLPTIKHESEKLIEKIDIIYAGLQKILVKEN